MRGVRGVEPLLRVHILAHEIEHWKGKDRERGSGGYPERKRPGKLLK